LKVFFALIIEGILREDEMKESPVTKSWKVFDFFWAASPIVYLVRYVSY
jgi:hypothetical protein